jgi:UDP-N-acetylmuramyl tripeptide synthase
MISLVTSCKHSIQVRDIQKTMSVAAKTVFQNPDSELSRIAISGTNGKTTTAYLCRAMMTMTFVTITKML